jgi:hypothetical protein
MNDWLIDRSDTRKQGYYSFGLAEAIKCTDEAFVSINLSPLPGTQGDSNIEFVAVVALASTENINASYNTRDFLTPHYSLKNPG